MLVIDVVMVRVLRLKGLDRKKVKEMGSYTESDDSHRVRAERRNKMRSRLDERGYDVVQIGVGARTHFLYVHRMCGGYVALLDAHDSCCPARDLAEGG